ncbi:MAG: 50S ribosomal protein L24 [Pyrinomonadaceae bacterium]|nr:50S ribosomal protein L24 [Pyrinomonadaceae bacterium]
MKRQKIKGAVRTRIKRGDEVVFVAGKEFNRYDSEGNRNPYRGKVIAVDPRTGRVKVDGAMIVKKHRKAVPQMDIKGGIINKEAWVNISNVAVVDPETGKPTRVKYEIREGEKVRVAKSGAVIPEQAAFAKVETAEEPEETAEETVEETAEEAVEEQAEPAVEEAEEKQEAEEKADDTEKE